MTKAAFGNTVKLPPSPSCRAVSVGAQPRPSHRASRSAVSPLKFLIIFTQLARVFHLQWTLWITRLFGLALCVHLCILLSPEVPHTLAQRRDYPVPPCWDLKHWPGLWNKRVNALVMIFSFLRACCQTHGLERTC